MENSVAPRPPGRRASPGGRRASTPVWILLLPLWATRDIVKDCVEIVVTMPKLKSRKAAAKRFRRSGSGKIMRRKAFKNHMLQHKNAERRSRLSKIALVSEEDAPNVELMLPYL